MRYKSQPFTVRAGNYRPSPPPSTPRPRPRRLRDWLATLPLLLLIPALVMPLLSASAATPSIKVEGALRPGGAIILSGSGFPGTSSVQVRWDRETTGMPVVVTTPAGEFSSNLIVPLSASGRHTISAALVADASQLGGQADVVASIEVTVQPGETQAAEGVSASNETAAEGARRGDAPSASSLPTTATVPPQRGRGHRKTPTPVPTPTTKPAEATAPRTTPEPTPTTAPRTTPAPTPVPTKATPVAPDPTLLPTPTPVPASPAPGGDLYVATWGRDTNPGTAAAPFRTVAKGLSTVRAGQTLFVRGGSYYENITSVGLHPGTPAARVQVSAYPGERPVIVGLLWLKGMNYWTVSGINVTWNASNASSQHMVKLTNGVGWVFRNAEVWGARSYAGILIAGNAAGQPAGWTLTGNCVHDTYSANSTNQDHNLYVNSGLGAGAGLISDNVFFNAANGENIKLGGSTSDASAGSTSITIRHNTLYNASQPILLAGGTNHVLIERNIIDHASSGYLIRGYRLSGVGNVARYNLGYGASALIRNDAGYSGVADGGANVFPRNPNYASMGCGGFQPLDSIASGYGY